MVWDLVLRLGGQWRMISGMGGAHVLGWDMGAALPLADALGLDRWLVAQILPDVETAATAAMNEAMRDG